MKATHKEKGPGFKSYAPHVSVFNFVRAENCVTNKVGNVSAIICLLKCDCIFYFLAPNPFPCSEVSSILKVRCSL
jgi:hypothetical protein